MIEVTVLGDGVVMIGRHELPHQKAARLHEEEAKAMLKKFAEGKWKSPKNDTK